MRHVHVHHKFDDRKAIEEFLNTGVAYIEAPYLYNSAGKTLAIVNDLFDSANEDELKKMRFHFSNNDSYLGPIHKRREEGKDEKFIFDYSQAYPSILETADVRITPYENIVQAMKQIHDEVSERFLQFVDSLEGPLRVFAGIDEFEDRITMAEYLHMTRKILYPENINVAQNQHRADDHIDQCAITVHFFQDSPGLYLNDISNVYVPKEGHILLFAGAKMAKLTGGRIWRENVERNGVPTSILRSEGGKIPAIRHGVIADTSSNLTRRNVGVSFFHTRTSLF